MGNAQDMMGFIINKGSGTPIADLNYQQMTFTSARKVLITQSGSSNGFPDGTRPTEINPIPHYQSPLATTQTLVESSQKMGSLTPVRFEPAEQDAGMLFAGGLMVGGTEEKGVNYVKEMNDYLNLNDYIFLGKSLVSFFPLSSCKIC
jgi:hypothetical protein